MKYIIFTSLLLAFILQFIGHGLFNVLFKSDINRCLMTFMFQYPQYTNIPSDNKIQNSFKYSLKYYSEGSTITNYNFSGQPVIYVHGNVGSFMTVRSLASVALRMSISRMTNFHFDYFSVDFNKEPSALSGDILEKQSEYLALAINQVLSYYKGGKEVILIAHSIGGLVINKALHDNKQLVKNVPLIIYMASPISLPVLINGPKLFQVYQENESFLRDKHLLKETLLVSFTGGSRDIQVIDAKGDLISENHLHFKTSALKNVWATCDHLCILWCKQLILNLNRVLFQVFHHDRQSVNMRDEFVKHFTQDILDLEYSSPVITLENESWIDNVPSSKSFKRNYDDVEFFSTYITKEVVTYHVDKLHWRYVFIHGLELTNDWLYLGREANGTTRFLSLVNTDLVSIQTLPTINDEMVANKKAVLVDLDQKFFRKDDFLIVKFNPGKNPYTSKLVMENFQNLPDRIKSMKSVNVGFEEIHGMAKALTINSKNDERISYFRLHLPVSSFLFGPTLPAPRVHVKPTLCKVLSRKTSMFNFISPADRDLSYENIILDTDAIMTLQVSKVPSPNQSPYLDFFLDPDCKYEISFSYSLYHWIGQILKIHAPHMMGFVCAYQMISLLMIMLLNKKVFDADRLIFQEIMVNSFVASLFTFLHMQMFKYNPTLLSLSDWYKLQEMGLVHNYNLHYDNMFAAYMSKMPLLLMTLALGVILPVISYLLTLILLGITKVALYVMGVGRWSGTFTTLFITLGPLFSFLSMFIISDCLGLIVLAVNVIVKASVVRTEKSRLPYFLLKVAFCLLLMVLCNSEELIRFIVQVQYVNLDWTSFEAFLGERFRFDTIKMLHIAMTISVYLINPDGTIKDDKIKTHGNIKILLFLSVIPFIAITMFGFFNTCLCIHRASICLAVVITGISIVYSAYTDLLL